MAAGIGASGTWVTAPGRSKTKLYGRRHLRLKTVQDRKLQAAESRALRWAARKQNAH